MSRPDRLAARPRAGWFPALCGLLLAACAGQTTPDGAPSDGAPTDDALTIAWLDDASHAPGVADYRLAGTITAPRSQETSLRRAARDALVDRARSLGFRRLDNMQIEASCEEGAPQATACTARMVAIASR